MPGESYSVFEQGSVSFTMVIIVVTVRIAIATHFHHWGYQVRQGLS